MWVPHLCGSSKVEIRSKDTTPASCVRKRIINVSILHKFYLYAVSAEWVWAGAITIFSNFTVCHFSDLYAYIASQKTYREFSIFRIFPKRFRSIPWNTTMSNTRFRCERAESVLAYFAWVHTYLYRSLYIFSLLISQFAHSYIYTFFFRRFFSSVPFLFFCSRPTATRAQYTCVYARKPNIERRTIATHQHILMTHPMLESFFFFLCFFLRLAITAPTSKHANARMDLCAFTVLRQLTSEKKQYSPLHLGGFHRPCVDVFCDADFVAVCLSFFSCYCCSRPVSLATTCCRFARNVSGV